MPIRGSISFENILGLGEGQDWVVKRYPFEDAGTETLAKMSVGYLVKFNATADGVIPALEADDAVLAGIIVGLPTDEETGVTGVKTVAVAQQGRFNANQVLYADAWDTTNPLTAAAINRLASLGIFLDPAVKAGTFIP